MDSIRKQEDKPTREDKSQRVGSFNTRKSLVVGLTGGIATGKTTVARMLKELGAVVISADEVVHRLMDPGTEAWHEIVAEFGQGILASDGSIDRKILGEIVFRNPEKRKRLESILHPRVIEYLTNEANKFRSEGHGILVLEIPLLVETSTTKIVDKVLVVTAEQEAQIERLRIRYGIDREAALLRIKSQLPIAEKIKQAEWVISTDGTMLGTKEQLQVVWALLQKSLAQL